MHGIMKAGRGDLPIIRGEHCADGVTVIPIPTRRRKHAGKLAAVESGAAMASSPVASVSLTIAPLRRRSAAGNNAGVGSTVLCG